MSVIAKGARRTRGRVGSGVDLFAEGEAQIYVKPTRDLHTLSSFDVNTSRAGLALEMTRFTAASALAELTLRVGGDDVNPEMFDGLSTTLDAVAAASNGAVVERALAGAWRIIADAGFAPALGDCAACHVGLSIDSTVAFSHPAGGALCDNCAGKTPPARRLPPAARAALRDWQAGLPGPALTQSEARAHQRLLREFIREHVTSDDRPLRAFAAWETGLGSQPIGAG